MMNDKKSYLAYPQKDRPPYRQWIMAAILLFMCLWLIWSLANNKNIDYPVIPRFMFQPVILMGVVTTLFLTFAAMVLGIMLGLVAAVGRMSKNHVVKAIASFYIWFFRGTPVLVQMIFWFNIAILFPSLSVPIPFLIDLFPSLDTNLFVTPLVAAILGLGLNSGAYIAEIFRAGIISVPKGQLEAAHSIGLSRSESMRKIVLPQAVPITIPPLGNEVISMLKYSSLASVIAVKELLGVVENIYATNLKTLELLTVASIWYLIITTTFTFLQRRLENRVNVRMKKRKLSVVAGRHG